MELEGATPVTSPGVKAAKVDENDEEPVPLEPQAAKVFRGLAARANYLAQDRPDIAYACKEICRSMSTPVEGSWAALKRLARYLVGAPRLVTFYGTQDSQDLHVYSDSDWAGCLQTRKPTSGGVIMRGAHIYTTGRPQATVALSVAESELNALIKGDAKALV